MKKYLLAVLGSGVWINVSEFIRNELVIKKLWINGFNEMGLTFPSTPINGAVWGLWAFIFASILAWLTTRFSTLSSALIAWITGFVLLWLAMINMGVLPSGIIYWAVPWSFIEVYIAAQICSKIITEKTV
ncbi:hypothetical protein ACFLZ5_08425 [Thermodesulfobacteriota bacterium]